MWCVQLGGRVGTLFYFTNVILLYNTCGFMFNHIFLQKMFFQSNSKVAHNKIVDVLKVYTLVIYLHHFISWSQQYLGKASYIKMVVCTSLVWKWCPAWQNSATSNTDTRKPSRNEAEKSLWSQPIPSFCTYVLNLSWVWETLCCFQQRQT